MDHRPLVFDLLARRRFRARQCLTHHSPMYPQLVRHSTDRPNPELVFPANLFEQFHFRSPLHPAPPASSAECFGFARWAILEHRNGPLYGIEITAEIPVSLPHPRNRLDNEFHSIVDEFYSILTSRATESIGAQSQAILHSLKVAKNAWVSNRRTFARALRRPAFLPWPSGASGSRAPLRLVRAAANSSSVGLPTLSAVVSDCVQDASVRSWCEASSKRKT